MCDSSTVARDEEELKIGKGKEEAAIPRRTVGD
jgi:hypothetical protein